MKLLGSVPAKTMKSSAAVFQRDDVIYGRLRPYLNKVCKPGFKGLCSSEFIVLPDQPHLRSSYLQYRLNSTDFTRFASSLNAGDRPRVDFEQIGEFEIELPEEREQLQIVAKIEELFSDLDAGIASLERAREKLKRYRTSVLKAAVEGRLTEKWRDEQKAKGIAVEPAAKLLERILVERRKKWEAAQLKKFTGADKHPPKSWQAKYLEPEKLACADLPTLPETWVWASLSHLVVTGPQNGLYLPSAAYGTGRPIIRIDDYQSFWSRSTNDLRQVSASEGEVSTYSLCDGDLLINRVNSLSHLGKVLRVNQTHLPALFESNMMRMALASEVNVDFVALYFKSTMGKRRLIQNAKHAVNQASINQQDVLGTALPLPPIAEQFEMVTQVEGAFSSITHAEGEIEHSLAHAARLRQAILKRAFEGRLV